MGHCLRAGVAINVPVKSFGYFQVLRAVSASTGRRLLVHDPVTGHPDPFSGQTDYFSGQIGSFSGSSTPQPGSLEPGGVHDLQRRRELLDASTSVSVSVTGLSVTGKTTSVAAAGNTPSTQSRYLAGTNQVPFCATQVAMHVHACVCMCTYGSGWQHTQRDKYFISGAFSSSIFYY